MNPSDFIVFVFTVFVLVVFIEISQLICNNSYQTGFNTSRNCEESMKLSRYIGKIWVREITVVFFFKVFKIDKLIFL